MNSFHLGFYNVIPLPLATEKCGKTSQILINGYLSTIIYG